MQFGEFENSPYQESNKIEKNSQQQKAIVKVINCRRRGMFWFHKISLEIATVGHLKEVILAKFMQENETIFEIYQQRTVTQRNIISTDAAVSSLEDGAELEVIFLK